MNPQLMACGRLLEPDNYDRRKTADDTHNAALRNLANKLLSKLWHCLQTNTPYHETSAWPTLETAAA
jgi:hypothetical protein